MAEKLGLKDGQPEGNEEAVADAVALLVDNGVPVPVLVVELEDDADEEPVLVAMGQYVPSGQSEQVGEPGAR